MTPPPTPGTRPSPGHKRARDPDAGPPAGRGPGQAHQQGRGARRGDLCDRAQPRLPGARVHRAAPADRSVAGRTADAQWPVAGAAARAAAPGRSRLHRTAGQEQAAHVPEGPDLLRRHRRSHGPSRHGHRGRPHALVRADVAIGTAGEPGHHPVTADAEVVALQLGRPPRGLRRAAHRCPCGLPDVVETAPRLADGTPFPTLYYLTCPRATAAVARLEAAGVMRQMEQRLATDPELRTAYRAAHRDYLARRDAAARAAGVEPLPPGTQSAGGMPDRVKCLHALAAQELAVPEANPLGREALTLMGEWWAAGPCVEVPGR